ncbi:methenyltetrahydromethanopterin cyclohydrolase [Novipirellula aureliae]|nr:methenyltetrahydromethanopterin cyclohydrolase [Novipirellula aureliae]
MLVPNSVNERMCSLFDQLIDQNGVAAGHDASLRASLRASVIEGAKILDAGVHHRGSLAGGIALARLCLADLADVAIVPCDRATHVVSNSVFVRTDRPVEACLASQYAGWPVSTDDFFAMGSGPMRLVRGKEEMLHDLGLAETASVVVGVLEAEKLPTVSAIRSIAEQCRVAADQIRIAIAPSTSIAGTIQVVARSIETAMHKLYSLGFDVTRVVSATGNAPIAPVAKTGDTVRGIGRTNDAILYGGEVTLWVDCDDEAVEAIAEKVPSPSSADHGRPFAAIFEGYDFDFYKVDPLLFSPALVTFSNLRTGRTWTSGKIETDILRKSFL